MIVSVDRHHIMSDGLLILATLTLPIVRARAQTLEVSGPPDARSMRGNFVTLIRDDEPCACAISAMGTASFILELLLTRCTLKLGGRCTALGMVSLVRFGGCIPLFPASNGLSSRDTLATLTHPGFLFGLFERALDGYEDLADWA